MNHEDTDEDIDEDDDDDGAEVDNPELFFTRFGTIEYCRFDGDTFDYYPARIRTGPVLHQRPLTQVPIVGVLFAMPLADSW
jgi:hypothetical protein